MLCFVALAVLDIVAVTPGPTAVVREGNASVQSALETKGIKPDEVAGRVEAFVDFGELAKRALGHEEWSKLSKSQQADFVATMKGLLRASYAQKAIGQAEAQVKYGKESLTGNEAEVPTTVTVQKDTVPVVYRLFRVAPKGAWKIYDVVTDDVSLLETYQGQFRKLIADKGFQGLLTTLKNKRAQLEKAGEAPASN